ncbi:DUF742 domain-containing protein [Streptomyces sp. A7024]|uniref:DUF742 domain-containing protein n=1 Tax=Streptomyces coryli TaxID=1128680 RepID=A0A6G4UA63_9ACTN|nr:DUF742 domain-containing protein [Streptomyces coryli]NGN69064.1 DUF742 domain-containing protein [Streptomyces coryli]
MTWDPQQDGSGRDASPVRPYVITGGRAAGAADAEPLPLEALVVATGLPLPPQTQPEYRRITDRCRGLLSVAEVSAHLELSPGVVQVLLSDLIAAGHIQARPPLTTSESTAAGDPYRDVLGKVLHGLENRL